MLLQWLTRMLRLVAQHTASVCSNLAESHQGLERMVCSTDIWVSCCLTQVAEKNTIKQVQEATAQLREAIDQDMAAVAQQAEAVARERCQLTESQKQCHAA